ncbi:C-type lectin domain family 4 member E-like isoform X2 [Toxotes jaculatrix]|uniref:C-type lectin domain family 4 member E-like isoform X2 n=1 Tax=Toxotes jaculatrix TaxID=941984 RepID=UPI001B3B1447|nr:C-type lectin domain family 4 member E-like isoform X2 [Toxotes jaculatrix]XP_040909022.1 C-type lectin domain family 4 member E-like isoform X2 [Toxotes jaculatrix]
MSRSRGDTEGEAPASKHTNSGRGSKVTSERVALLVVCSLLAAAVIVIYRLSFAHFQTKKNLQTLREECEAVKRNLTERSCETKQCNTVCPKCPKDPEVKINQTCIKCERGWEQHGGKCYYFSISSANWEKSRNFCQRRRGDLVKIDSREEQIFLVNRVREKRKEHADMFWIGLTDSKEEGKWFWVDGSPLNTSLTFWASGEPNNLKQYNANGEDCVRIGEERKAYDLRAWWDRSCHVNRRSICEKHEENGRCAEIQ